MADNLTDILVFWQPFRDLALDENFLPWGAVARGSSGDKQLRVFNASSNYTASGIVVSIEEMGLAEPTRPVAVQHYLSLDGRRFTATVTLPALPPRGVSSRITLRRVVAPDADLGQGDFQLLAHATWI